MKWVKPLVSPSYWRQVFSPKKAITSLLAAFGTLWLLVEVTSFFSQEAAIQLKTLWLTFLILGVVWAIWENLPRHRVAYRLSGRDVGIEIRVGDLFSLPGAIVVGTNTTFDTDIGSGMISRRSVQGVFTTQYYDNVRHLDHELEQNLEGVSFDNAGPIKKGKKRIYPVGTCVKLSPRGRDSYLVAVATMNDHGTALASLEDLRTSLPRLWEFIATRGDCGPLVMPVLGSGYGRLPQTREEIIREIVQSFVAACASQRFCEMLTIAIPISDFYGNEIDLEELGEFIRHVCRYTDLKSSSAAGGGSPVS